MITLNIWDSLPQAIQDEHGPRLRAYFPNTRTIPDPDWIDPEDGTEAPQILEFTEKENLDNETKEWLKRCSAKGQIKINAANNIITNPIE